MEVVGAVVDGCDVIGSYYSRWRWFCGVCGCCIDVDESGDVVVVVVVVVVVALLIFWMGV